ncbi:UNVERIFIED_CONTAM: cation transport ATPase-like protein [Acetivibrio alkalicellulosi]
MELIPYNNIITNVDKKNKSNIIVNEIFLDGKIKKAEQIDEDEKSFGIFMHSLILSNYAEVMKVNNSEYNVIGNEFEKAIFKFTASKGFNKGLIETIAPKVNELTFEYDNNLKVSTHMINEKMRIVSKGTPDKLLKRCSHILHDSKFVKITSMIYKEVNSKLFEMIERCHSVYAIAIKDISKINKILSRDTYVRDMTLVALVGMVVT